MRISELLARQYLIDNALNSLVYGSIEIREQNNKKIMYLHYRKDGVHKTIYLGLSTAELFDLVSNNNILANKYKKELKLIKKELARIKTNNNINPDAFVYADCVKAKCVEIVHSQAKLEGIEIAYDTVDDIYNNNRISGIYANDVIKILNLFRTWRFVLTEDVLKMISNVELLKEINYLVEVGLESAPGNIRVNNVKIAGSTYLPPKPFESSVNDYILQLLAKPISSDVAIDLMLFIMKKQLFLDGNKRTAVIFANHYMISNALGLIVIPYDKVPEFKKMLVSYYEDVDTDSIKAFLRNCIIKLTK